MFINLKYLKVDVEKYKDSISLLHEVMSSKVDNAISFGILKINYESLLHWMQSIKYKMETMVKAEKQLKKVHELVKKG